MKNKTILVSRGVQFKEILIALLLSISLTSWSQIISTFAGNTEYGAVLGNGGYSGDGGPSTDAELNYPHDIAIDVSGNVYIADYSSSLIRIVNTSGIISTFAGIASGAISGTNEGYSGDGGPATAAELNTPQGVVVDASGNVYIADYPNNLIRIVNTSGIISTFAGIASGAISGANEGYSGDGGPATAAELNYPSDIAVDAFGNVYIADKFNNLIRIVNTSGTISTFAGIANGAISGANEGYSGDGGAATAAELNYPSGVAVDASGNVYIADSYNSLIRIVNTSGIISTFAGIASGAIDGTNEGYSGDGGPATTAELYEPYEVTIDAFKHVYIADKFNNLIRIVNASGIISTFAGNVNYGAILDDGGYSGDGGPATAAELYYPTGVTVDDSGNVYIADFANNIIRKVTPSFLFNVSGNVAANISCDGGSNGSASVNSYKGISPYTYSWFPSGGTNSTATGLSAGIYTVTVTDGGDSTASDIVIITQPIALSTTASVISNACNSTNNGNASVTPSGGTSPYTYSWSNGYTSNPTGAILSAGTYTVAVQDNCGASVTASITITQPNALSTTASVVFNINCNGGNNGDASATPLNGTSPYIYSWSNGITSNPTGDILTAGTYTVTVQDSCGASATASVTITQPIALSTTASVISNACSSTNNGNASATPSDGNSPYTYSWSNGSTSNPTGDVLSVGTYTVTVQDNCGASATASVTIPQFSTMTISHDSASATVGCNGIAAVTPSGGASPYTYSWSFGQTTDTIEALCANSYCCTITDNNGCSQTTCVTVKSATGIDNISNSSSISIYPNPTSGTFTISGISSGQVVNMYNYLGENMSSLVTDNNSNLQLNISDQANGIYLIRILNKDGTIAYEQKIVKIN